INRVKKTKINKSFAGVQGELFQKPPLVVYKTGDLACRLPGGNIIYMGRMDFQVKIRGIRIELKEIEAHLDAHPDIRDVTVTAREDMSGDKYLAAYVAPVQGITNLDVRELREYLATKLPEYMIPSSFVILDRMPLTPTGKLDRWALMALTDTDTYDAADEPGMGEQLTGKNRGYKVQETLVGIWQKILKVKKVDIHDNFFQLGGHSLRVMKVISEIRNHFDVPVRGTDLFERPTIKELADFILSLNPDIDKEDYPILEAVEKRDYYPASSLQKRLYILDRMENIGIAYNIPDVKVLNGKITYGCLEEVCRLLIRRHESLRISFRLVGEELALQIHEPEELEFHMSYFETAAGTINRILEDFVQPFDLNLAPLFRACLIKIEEEKFLFCYDMHHIIADGMSSLILEHELVQLLENRELPGLAIQYKDFSQWQYETLKSGKLKKQEDYWFSQFHGEIPALNLPLDYPPPAVQSFAGDAFDFKIETGLKGQLNGLLEETGATLYMVLLAVYNVLLARYTGQEDVIIGSPTAGRNPVRTGSGVGANINADLGNIIGLFINVMLLRNMPTGAKTFMQFLEEVKVNVLNAFENQEYPYGELIEKLALKKDLSKNPLFSVELVVHNTEIFGADGNVGPGGQAEKKEPGLNDYGYVMKISQVDITLVAVEQPGSIACTFIYCTRLFKRETIERFARHFTRLLDHFTANPYIRIADVPLLSDEEKLQILLNSNGVEVPLVDNRCVHRLIGEQVETMGDRVAIVGAAEREEKKRRSEEEEIEEGHISYRE
ncbi:MAG TPA: condensation domain-containing protein, partial [Candidatus Deferrimicrobium sp.]|nr:condensation domain-containing protein [Candidatus Deferrimicrobium sp.]